MKNEERRTKNGEPEDLSHSSFSVPRSSFFVPPVRFVLLIHDHPFVHWDLLVQRGEVLRSWRLLESPDRWQSAAQSVDVSAEAIADHRLVYLDYEGPVSRERGQVARWDHGQAEWLADGESSAQLRLSGERLVGEVSLDRDASRSLWTARFCPAD
jgi:hypothetical protein